MEKIDALSQVLQDPTRSQRDKDIARAALDRARANVTDAAMSELLLQLDKPLTQTSYYEIHAFCGARGWPKTRPLYDLWLNAYFTTENGRQDALRIAEYLRKHDLDEWGYAADEWRDSGFKSTTRLIGVLERITDSPDRGNYHLRETVEMCRELLADMRRRAGEVQP